MGKLTNQPHYTMLYNETSKQIQRLTICYLQENLTYKTLYWFDMIYRADSQWCERQYQHNLKKEPKRVGVSEGNKFHTTSHYLCLILYKL